MASVIGVGPWQGESRRGRDRRSLPRSNGHSSTVQSIEQEVIARLLMAQGGRPTSLPVGAASIGPDEVADFAPLAVTLEAHELLSEVEAFMARGLGAEEIFIDLLAPAARLLGEEWTADRLDFLDVTMGLWRLQEVLREVAARTPAQVIAGGSRKVLFSPFPGDQHSFGTAIIDECFARAGWNTDLLIDPTRPLLLQRLARSGYDLVGLTVSCDCHIGALPALVVAVREASRNPDIRVMLGGRVFQEDPDLARRVGADGTAGSALEALDLADRLLVARSHAAVA